MTVGDSAEATILMHQAYIRHFDPFGVAQGGLREKSRSVHALPPRVGKNEIHSRGTHARGWLIVGRCDLKLLY